MKKNFKLPAAHRMRNINHIHFVGIGGIGMSGIAEVLLEQGYQVSGSDLKDNPITDQLAKLGATIYLGHDAKWIQGADVVVTSSAVNHTNPEVQAAISTHIPVIPRALMLTELMRFYYGIALAGTHGKTTTTSLVTSILIEGKLDPTFVIGGKLNSAGSNARLGSGEYFVAEADESDASFLHLLPTIAAVTNIDADHMDTYHGDFAILKKTFVDFLHKLPFYGLAVLCIDDPVVREILPQISRPTKTYGFSPDADVRAVDFSQSGTKVNFTVKRKDHADLPITLNLAGEHNCLNALAAIIIGTELQIPDKLISSALAKFAGVGRRFQSIGQYHLKNGVKINVIDDYGHHPREIAAVIKAARASWPKQRLVMAFQPHRYTRTRDLFTDFVKVLSQTDQLILLEVYSAGEAPIAGINAQSLGKSIGEYSHQKPIMVTSPDALPAALDQVLRDGDILLSVGAGSISAMMHDLVDND